MTSFALLIARIGVGVVFVAHGWQKFNDMGLSAVGAGFDGMGVPAPQLAAYFATFVELIGGALLLLGAFTAVAGLLLALNMLGAFVFVHVQNGVFVNDGGFELVVALGVASLLLAVLGAGKYSLDAMLGDKVGRAGALSKA